MASINTYYCNICCKNTDCPTSINDVMCCSICVFTKGVKDSLKYIDDLKNKSSIIITNFIRKYNNKWSKLMRFENAKQVAKDALKVLKDEYNYDLEFECNKVIKEEKECWLKEIEDLKRKISIKDEKIKSYKIRLSIVSVCKKCLKGQPYNVARYGGLCRACA